MSATDDVGVQVVDRLPGVAVGIYDSPIAALLDPVVLGHLPRQLKDGGEDLGVGLLRLRKGDDMGLGDDEDVNRGLWVNVPEGDGVIAFRHDGGRNLALDDAAEETGI